MSIIETIESDGEFLTPIAARLREEAFFDRRGGRQMGRHHPLSISGHVGRFDVVPTPRRRRKRSKNGTTGGEKRERENQGEKCDYVRYTTGGKFVKLVRGATQSGRKRGYHFLREEPSAGPTGGGNR